MLGEAVPWWRRCPGSPPGLDPEDALAGLVTAAMIREKRQLVHRAVFCFECGSRNDPQTCNAGFMARWRAPGALFSVATCLVASGFNSAAASRPASSEAIGRSSTGLALGMAPSGAEDPASAIPWRAVGQGWFVALWGPHAAFEGFPPPRNWEQQATTIFLVDPLGGRYRVAALPAPSSYQLFDWSGDGRRILVRTPSTGTDGRFDVEDIDLATGKVLHDFRGSNSVAWYQYSRPKGLAILASSQAVGEDGLASLVRLSLSGGIELVYPSSFPGVGALAPSFSGVGGVLASLDGTELVVEAKDGLALVANNGTFIRDLGPRGETCSPERWWDSADLVVSCEPTASETGEVALWLVPASGEAAAQLTHPKPPDLGDVNGWKIGTAVYTQALGPCGSQFLARRKADGSTAAVSVPSAKYDVHVVGTYGTRLALQAMLGCGTGPSLFWFDPATAKETPLLGSPMNGGSVLAALPYPGLES